MLDSFTGEAVVRVTDDFSRIERTLPGVPIAQLQNLLRGGPQRLVQQFKAGGLQLLRRLHHEWQNTLRACRVRSVRGEHIEAICDRLFTRYVAMPNKEVG